MGINLTKALKKKAKLIASISTYKTRFIDNNSVEEGEEQSRSYDPKESYDSYIDSVAELVKLKAAINLANVPIYEKICKLSELKGVIKVLKDLVIKEGKFKDPYSRDEPSKYTSSMTRVDRDNRVAELQDRIEDIQSEIESFNAITSLKV